MTHKLILLLIGLFFGIIHSNLYAQNSQLTKIQTAIQEQEKLIQQRNLLLQQQQATLATQENEIKQALHRLTILEKELKDSNSKLAKDKKQIQALQAQIDKQKAILSKQLYMAYKLKHSEYVLDKLADPNSLDPQRMKTYFIYVNTTLMKQINELAVNADQLQINIQQLASTSTVALDAEQRKLQQQQQQKQQQQQIMANLAKELEASKQKLIELKQNEKRLQDQITQAQKKAKLNQQKAKGLGKANKQYSAPVKGSLYAKFDEIQMGELRWKGIVIKAKQGVAVKAIAQGEVILVDHLAGYGLIIVLSHGEGYMSLYGYNQSTKVKVGDIVDKDQTISQVGHSSDRNITGLYFEIRHQGIAVNPESWLKI